MTNRIFTTPTSQFGLVGWLEETQVRLPLKGVECGFHACGDLLSVEIDQIFHHDGAAALDCIYSFPLPAQATVYRCEMHINGRVVRARVEGREQARALALQQKAAGRRTALVEVERDNLFTLSLGNVQPGDMIVIRFAFFETLTRLADWTSVRIPFCPGVRYIPGEPLLRSLRGSGICDDTDQVPDASRISPPRIEALHPQAAYLSVRGTIENPLGRVADISSASHPVVVVDQERRWTISLASQDTVPDCDFSLRWTESRGDQAEPASGCAFGDAAGHALVLLSGQQAAPSPSQKPQDFYFIVDRSNSMEGLKWEKAVESFRAFLNQLAPEDRAWVTFFSDRWHNFAEKPLNAAELAGDPGLSTLHKFGTDGGTEILPALRHTLEVIHRHSVAREAQLILITDGQIGNEAAILECLRPHPDLCVHTFGIDTAVNDALLKKLAADHHGVSCLMQPTDDIVGAVSRLRGRLRSPVMTSITPGEGWERPGDGTLSLFSEGTLSLVLRHASADIGEATVRGRLADGSEQTLRLPLIRQAGPALGLLWARERIQCLIDQHRTEDAISLAKQHNILCEGAAFVAWDEAEQVAIARREVYQPALMLGAANAVLCDVMPEKLGKLSGGYRSRAGGSSSSTRHSLLSLLHTKSARNAANILARFGRRLAEWHERFVENVAFGVVVSDGALAETLMEWAVDGGAQAEQRMSALEQLVATLESAGPTPEAGLKLTREWLATAMADDVHAQARRRIADLLEMAERLTAEIRELESESGVKLL